MAYQEFAGELDRSGGGFVEFDGQLDHNPKRDLPEGIKPSTAGAGRGTVGLDAYQRPAAVAPREVPWMERATFGDTGPSGSVLEGKQLFTPESFDFKTANQAQRAVDDTTADFQARVQQHGSIGPIVGPKAGAASVAKGVAADLVASGKGVRAGVNQMAADLTGNEHFADQARRERGQVDLMTAVNTPEFESDTARGIYSGLSSTVRQAPSLAAAILTRNPNLALAGMVAPMVPEEYAKFRQRGATPGEALSGAVGTAATEYLTEKMPMGVLVNKFGKTGAAQFMGELLAKEIPGEQVATVVQDAIDTAVANPDKTWGDYWNERPGAAYQTLLATLTQTGVMGGANAGAQKLDQHLQARDLATAIRADANTVPVPQNRTEQIKALRQAGDGTAADLLQRRQDRETSVYKAEQETTALADFGPLVQQHYKSIRLNGAMPGDAVTHAAARSTFEVAAQLAGLSPKAVEATIKTMDTLPADKVPGFVEKAVKGLADRGLAQPFDGIDTIASTIDAQRERLLDAVLSGEISPTLERPQDDPQETTIPQIPEAEPQAIDASSAEAVAAGDLAAPGGNQSEPVDALSTEWQQFSEQTGTLNVPRAEMPQVKTAHRGPLVNFLGARGVTSEQVEVDPAELKPTQAEYSQTKAQEAADRDTDRSILISNDGHIIDGHHQAIAKLQNGKPVRAIRLNAPAAELLPLLHEFPSSTVDQSSDVQNPPHPTAGTQAQATPDQAPQAVGSQPTGPAAGVPAAGSAAVEAPGVIQQPAQQQQAKDSGRRARAKAWETNPLRAFLGEHGIHSDLASEFAPGPKERRQAMVPGYGPIFRKSGKNLDMLAEAARDAGFIQSEDPAELHTLISKAFRGERVAPLFAEGVADQIMEKEAQARFEDYQEQQSTAGEGDPFGLVLDDDILSDVGYDDATRQKQDEFAAFIAMAEAEGLDVEALQEQAFYETQDGTDDDYRNQARSLVAAARSQRTHAGAGENPVQGREAAQPGRDRDGREVPGAQGPQATEPSTDPEVTAELRADGTLAVMGDKQALRERLIAAGIPAKSILPSATGVVVGRTQAKKAQDALTVPTLTAPTQGEVLANQDRAAQADKLDERAQIKRESEAGAGLFQLQAQDGRQDTTGSLFDSAQNADIPEQKTPSAEQKSEKPKQAAAITDFGEKIGGAKKDLWTGFSDELGAVSDDDIANHPLSKVWPAPDYQALIDGGASPEVVAFVRAARDEVPAKPRKGYKVRGWADKVRTLRGFAMDLMAGKLTMADVRGQLEKSGSLSRSMQGFLGRIDLYQAVGHAKSLEGIQFGWHHFTLYRGQENVSMWVVEKDSAASTFSNWPSEIATGKTKEEAIEAFRKAYDKLGSDKEAKKGVQFDIISFRGQTGYWIAKKLGRNHVKVHGPLATVQEARAYRDNNQAALVEKLEKIKEIPSERRDVNEPRVGEDMRNGADVTPEFFSDTFGFRGVEFGNWVEQGRRQQDLNNAFDALMDMAGVLGLPPKAMSLNGQLALAFGARGGGGAGIVAAAHYEPDKVVINLTKKNGAGSLGHEWWHAVDNYFAKMRKGDFMTTALDVRLASRDAKFVPYEGVRQEMVMAFGNVVKSINLTNMKQRSAVLDGKRSKEYWGTGEELSARAFEAYLIAKLQDQNASNDYLANILSEDAWNAAAALGLENENSYPYPIAKEVPGIRAAFDQFFQTVQTKETEQGVAMYSRPMDAEMLQRMLTPMAPLSVKETQAAVADMVKGWKNGPRLRVVANPSEFPVKAPSDARGQYFNGTAYLAASNHRSAGNVQRTLAHEAIAHYGLHTMLGDKEWLHLLNNIQQGIERGDKGLLELRDQVRYAYVDEQGNFNLKPEQEADEIAARAAEVGFDAKAGEFRPGFEWVKRVYARIAQFLRNLGLNVTFTHTELQGMLAQAQQFLTKPARGESMVVGAPGAAAMARDRTTGLDTAIIGNALGAATSHPRYAEAKAGNVEAAVEVARALVTPELVEQVRSAIGDRKPLIVPVVAEEASGRNKIPRAAAVLLAKELGLSYDQSIMQANRPHRTGLDGFDRIFAPVEFDGQVQAGQEYLLLDDTQTQGGTFASLASHIEAGGGRVVGAVALTGKQYSAKIALSNDTLQALREKLGDIEPNFQAATGYGFGALTESEARYLANFKPADTLRTRIVEEGRRRGDQADRGSAGLNEGPAYARGPLEPELPGVDQEQPEPPELPKESRARAAQRVIQDQFNRFTVIRNWAKEQGVNLSQLSDVWGFEERMHGRIATQIEDFREQRVAPLVTKIQSAGFTMDQVAEFLHAQHAAERNNQIAKIDPTVPDGSGMSNDDADAILEKSTPELAALANEFRSITDDTRQILLKAGIITSEMADAWTKAYKHYVPLKGGDEDTAPTGTGKGLSVKATNKRAMGHGARQEHIIENIMRDHERAVMLSEKNRVGHSLLAMVVELGRDDIATFDQPEQRKVLKQSTQYEVVGRNGAVLGTFDTMGSANRFITTQQRDGLTVRPVKGDAMVAYMASPMLAENEVQVYIKGHTLRIQLNDPLLARAYKRLGVEHLNKLLTVNREINNFLSKAYTGFNPEFFFKNVMRDFTAGVINITGREGAGIAAKAMANYPKAFGQMLRYSFTNGKSVNPMIAEYRKHGGSTGAAYLGDIERIGSDIKAAYEDYQGVLALTKDRKYLPAARSASRKLVGLITGWMEHLNAAGENAMRVAVFEAIRNTPGRTVEEAASAAKNATVNFNRKGEISAQMGAMYLFFNAGMQGSAATVGALTTGKHRHQAQVLAGSLALLAYSMAAMQFGGDDDEWEKIPDNVKDRNLVIRAGTDTYITLAVPYGYGYFFTLGNALFDLQRGADKDRVALNLASGLLEHFGPAINPLNGDEADAKGLIELMPGAIGGELMRASGRLLVNRSGMGSEIVPDSQFDDGKPDSQRMHRRTSGSVYDSTASTINQVTGGTKSQPGMIDVSPETLRFWTETVTGGAGKFVVDSASLGALLAAQSTETNPAKREALMPELREVPIVRTVVRKADVRDSRRLYWESVEKVKEAQQNMERAENMTDRIGLKNVYDEQGKWAALAGVVEESRDNVKAYRDYVAKINANEEYTLAEKRWLVKETEKKEEEIYKIMNKQFAKTNKQGK